jgi:hypothetical protein
MEELMPSVKAVVTDRPTEKEAMSVPTSTHPSCKKHAQATISQIDMCPLLV